MAKTTDTPKTTPAEIITNAIIAKLEAGVRPWVKPWRPGLGGRPLRATGDPYKGINCFWLWLCAEGAGYNSRTWMTYKQSQALGGQVCEGERSETAIFYKSYSKTIESPLTGDASDEMRRVLRSYAVFNCDQIDGLPVEFYPSPVTAVPPADHLPDRAQRFIDALPATVHIRGDRAFYDRTADSITMPPVELFSSRAFFASTLAHEAGHNAASRIMPNDGFKGADFSSSADCAYGIIFARLARGSRVIFGACRLQSEVADLKTLNMSGFLLARHTRPPSDRADRAGKGIRIMPSARTGNPTESALLGTPLGIIRDAALCPLCRIRHNSHWSGSPDRLNREFGKRFGDVDYAFEELCAEMTSALLGADLGLPTSHLDDYAAYLGSWLQVLRKDSRAKRR